MPTMKYPMPTFGETEGGRTAIRVHGPETRLVTSRMAYASVYLIDALRDLVALYEAMPGSDPYFVAKGIAAIKAAEGRD